ncbi:MAG: hypothetical protein ACI9JN_000429 [Bacteroidia bacterium]|jgi:hypothetical protein
MPCGTRFIAGTVITGYFIRIQLVNARKKISI